MAIFRVAKTRDYTVMSNYHLRDKNLTLKAKGLLSLILSLPEDWNYTTRGLAAICKEGVDSIGAALRELESAGYLTRHRLRDRSGRISDTEYVVYESPHKETEADSPDTASQGTDGSDTASPCTENPYMVPSDTEAPRTDASDTEKPAQLNTQVSNTYESNTQKSNPDPIIIQQQRAQQADTGMSDMDQMNAREYRESGWSPAFYREHKADIEAHKEAQAVYSAADGKLPTLAELSEEYDILLSQKRQTGVELSRLSEELKNLRHIKVIDFRCY